jgi:hypothetical protein
MGTDVGAWFKRAWTCLAVLVLLAVWATPRCILRCDASLSSAPEPDGWRTWPLADAGAMRRGTCLRDPYGLGYVNAPTQWVRHDPEGAVFVVATSPGYEEAPKEHFVEALRRTSGQEMVFASGLAAACLGAIVFALATMIVGLGVARRRLRLGIALGTADHRAHTALAQDPPTYRASPVASVPPPSRTRLADGEDRAARALQSALVFVAAIFASTLVGGACVTFLDVFFHTMHSFGGG